MKSFTIAWKDLIIRVSDKKGLLLMILMPIILTAILGAALSNVMNEGSNLPTTKLGIYQVDKDELGEIFVNDVLHSEDLKNVIEVHPYHSKSSLKNALEDGSVDVSIIIPAKWSEELNEGKIKEVTILADPTKEIQTSIIESITNTFVERVTILSSSIELVISDLAKSNPALIKEASTTVINHLNDIASGKEIAVKSTPIGKKAVTSMQYYAAAMGAMFLLFNAMVGAKSILNERQTDTLARLMSTPTSNTAILFGKFLGTLYYALLQFFVFYLTTLLAFKVDWGDNILQVFTIGFVYAIAVSGLSIAFASVVSTEKAADLIGSLGVQVLAILGGSMLPLTIFPDMMKSLANIAPNKWALASFLEIMGGTDWNSLSLPITVLLSIGFVSVIFGSLRLRIR